VRGEGLQVVGSAQAQAGDSAPVRAPGPSAARPGRQR
jgi:hypothetical protein